MSSFVFASLFSTVLFLTHEKTQRALALILFSMPQKHKWNAKTIGIHLTIIKLGKELPVEAKKPLNFNLLSFLLLEVLYSFEK